MILSLFLACCVVSNPQSFLAVGDSKSVTWDWQRQLVNSINTDSVASNSPEHIYGWSVTTPIASGLIARNGATVASTQALIDSDLASSSGPVTRVLLNLGANDVASLPTEAAWKANLTYILDALHTKWPSASVYIMRPWVRGEAADCNTLAAWIAAVVGTRSFTALGPDERVFLEGGDDGATYTSDGIHPNTAGRELTATEWKAALGY